MYDYSSASLPWSTNFNAELIFESLWCCCEKAQRWQPLWLACMPCNGGAFLRLQQHLKLVSRVSAHIKHLCMWFLYMTIIYIRGTGVIPVTFSAALLCGQLRKAPKTPQWCSLLYKARLMPVRECGHGRGAGKPGEGTAERQCLMHASWWVILFEAKPRRYSNWVIKKCDQCI